MPSLLALRCEKVPILEPAVGPLLDQILDANYDIWNEGLSRPAYGKWWSAQLAMPWARQTRDGVCRLGRTALTEGGQVLASAKEYLFDATLDGQSLTVLGIGAVFAQPDQRGRGFATLLIEQLLARAESRGVGLALLFSEIGPIYYERLGFTVVPTFETELRIARPPSRGAPAVLLRSGVQRDFTAISEMHDHRSAGFRFHLNRDADLVSYAITKKRLLAGLGPPGRREVHFFVAEEGGLAVAYVVASADPSWTIEECGDRDAAGARLGAILQVLVAREPAVAQPHIRAWLPDRFVPPQVEVINRQPSGEVMMVRPLRTEVRAAVSLQPDDIFYSRSDVF
jgi:predicted N-acetyltransferase YhbS